MESKANKRVDIFSKIGVAVTILPYYSMNKREWIDLLCLFNRNSREFYNKNINSLNNLFKSVECNNLESMQKLIKMYVDPNTQLNEKMVLYLNCNAHREKIVNFWKAASSFTSSKMRILFLIGIFALSKEEYEIVDRFLYYCLPKEIPMVNIETLSKGMERMLGCATDRINICDLENVTPKLLQQILIASRNVQSIWFTRVTCKINWMNKDSTEDFILDPSFTYKFTDINANSG